MLTFTVFDSQGSEQSVPEVESATLFITGETPTAGQVRAEPGRILCVRDGFESTGLSLLVDLDQCAGEAGLGRMMLKTCLLPQRDEAYLLSLELARHAIMLCLNKLEEWDLFESAEGDPAMERFEQGHTLFTQALIAHKSTGRMAEADRLSKKALALVVDASEKLSQAHAERSLADRLSGRTYARAAQAVASATQEPPQAGATLVPPGGHGVVLATAPLIGVTVTPGQCTEALTKAVAASADFITVPLRWASLEPSEGKLQFADTDKWIEWSVRTARLPVAAGPLLDFRPTGVPSWLMMWENDYETLRDLIIEHMQAVVTRYRRTVARWTVCSGLHVNNNLKLTVDQTLDLTRIAIMIVRKLHPSAQVQVEIAQPFGEYHSRNRKSVAPMVYAELLAQSGLGFDAFGVRLQFGQPAPGQAVRDLMSIGAILDRFAGFEKPVAITAIGVPARPISVDAPDRVRVTNDGADVPEDPGTWHGPWTESLQADWATQALALAIAKPYVHSVCWHELADPTSGAAPEMPAGGLVTGAGQTRLVAQRLAQLRKAVKERRSPFAKAVG